MQERGEVDRDLEVGVGRVGQEESGVLGRDAGLDHLLVERARLREERGHVVAESGPLDGLRDRIGEGAALVGDIALALLLEADADSVTNELVRERARNAGDAELEMHLLQRGHVTGEQAGLDELEHLLWWDAFVVDPIEYLLRGQCRIADAVRHVEGADRVLGVVDQLDGDSHVYSFISLGGSPEGCGICQLNIAEGDGRLTWLCQMCRAVVHGCQPRLRQMRRA